MPFAEQDAVEGLTKLKSASQRQVMTVMHILLDDN